MIGEDTKATVCIKQKPKDPIRTPVWKSSYPVVPSGALGSPLQPRLQFFEVLTILRKDPMSSLLVHIFPKIFRKVELKRRKAPKSKKHDNDQSHNCPRHPTKEHLGGRFVFKFQSSPKSLLPHLNLRHVSRHHRTCFRRFFSHESFFLTRNKGGN